MLVPAHEVLGLPALSPTMTQGNLAKWLKKEGDKIQPGDLIASIETDKATVDWEATEAGYLAKILIPEGSKDVTVGKVRLSTQHPSFFPFLFDAATRSSLGSCVGR